MMQVMMVLSPYYKETIIDEEGNEFVVQQRYSAASALLNGHYISRTDWLALPTEQVCPKHGLAIDLFWVSDKTTMQRLRDDYVVLVEDTVQGNGVIPKHWSKKEAVDPGVLSKESVRNKLKTSGIPENLLENTLSEVQVVKNTLQYLKDTATTVSQHIR